MNFLRPFDLGPVANKEHILIQHTRPNHNPRGGPGHRGPLAPLGLDRCDQPHQVFTCDRRLGERFFEDQHFKTSIFSLPQVGVVKMVKIGDDAKVVIFTT